jgi:hypothetical protein
MPNTIAKHVLAEYLETPEPRYALLINAPWGAGKTEFIKKQTQYETNQNFLYLSLFGIDSAQAFNEALLAAILRNPGNEFGKKTRSWGETIKNVISSSQAWGFSVNLSSFSLLEGLRKDLPDTLIFDDLERISMPQSTMSGLLNNFIEHDKRRVILIANTDQIKGDEKEIFDTTREKRIGQSIQISPDVEAALQSYWVSIPDGRGKTYLQKNQDLIKAIFQQGEHGNLRLLRYALQATANLLNKIDDGLFEFKQPIEKLTGTFLALHMAYGGRRILEVELFSRNDSRAFGTDFHGTQMPDKQISPLMELARAHPDCDIRIPYKGSPLPNDLAGTLLVKGYASADTINDQLRQTHFFAPAEDRPDWLKLWYWDELSVIDLTNVLNRLDAQLAADEITNPGEFIQIYGAMHWLARFKGIQQTKEQLSETFLGHIKSLSNASKIKPQLPSSRARERYVFGHENGGVNYCGHAFETDNISIDVVKAMKAAMENAYEADLPNVASSLLGQFETETEAFLQQIICDHNIPNYSSAPILHLMDKSRFSNRLLHLIQNDREVAKQVAAEIMERRQGRRGDLGEEHEWIDDLKAELQSGASAMPRLAGAQADLFIQRAF